jgi:hypothetical protein
MNNICVVIRERKKREPLNAPEPILKGLQEVANPEHYLVQCLH